MVTADCVFSGFMVRKWHGLYLLAVDARDALMSQSSALSMITPPTLMSQTNYVKEKTRTISNIAVSRQQNLPHKNSDSMEGMGDNGVT